MRSHILELLEAAKLLAVKQNDEMLTYLISMAVVEASSKATMSRRSPAA